MCRSFVLRATVLFCWLIIPADFLITAMWARAADSNTLAPGPVVVRVTSVTNEKGVAGCQVRLGERIAGTDVDGLVVFDEVPPGPHKLSINQPGFEAHTEQVQFEIGERQTLAVSLRPAP